MIAWLRGRVKAIEADSVVLDVGGVGYRVYATARALGRLPVTGEVAELWIETVFREDAIVLYGFASPDEQRWFRALRQIQGVGARLALSLLSSLSPDEIARAIAAGDRRALGRAHGIGPRLAGRIVAELRERLGSLVIAPEADLPPSGPSDTVADAVSALVHLGYGRSEALAAVSKARAAAGEDVALDQLIRDALRELAP
ncbi:Holliday junction ATP-dependent DNA helicase RuvA [bacterium HR40]|nr:Holliday junction ATP-dependent DNA helicase RuvA [bacterium HR40]